MAPRQVTAQRAAADVAVQIVGRLGNLALGLVTTAILARGLGEAQFGVWSTILLVPVLLGYFTDLGLQQVAVRLAAGEDDSGWIGALITAKAALAIPTYVIALGGFLAIGASGNMLVAGAIVSTQAFLGVPAALGSVFQVNIRNDLAVAALTAGSVVWLVAVILITRAGSSLVALAIAMVAGQLLTVGGTGIYALRFGRVPLRGTWTRWRRLGRIAIPLSIGTLLIVAYGRIDALIVYSAAGKVDAGLYQAAYRIFDQVGFIPLSLMTTLTPLITRAWPRDPPAVRRTLQLALDLLTMASFFGLAVGLAIPHAVIVLLYGHAFAGASAALPALMVAFVFVSAGYALGVYSLVLELTGRFARYALIALVFNVVANLLLVPSQGFLAAAWITAATEVIVSCLIGRDILRRLEMRLGIGRFARAAVAAGVAGVVMVALDRAGLPVWLSLPAGAVVDVGALLAVRALTVAELRTLRKGSPDAAQPAGT